MKSINRINIFFLYFKKYENAEKNNICFACLELRKLDGHESPKKYQGWWWVPIFKHATHYHVFRLVLLAPFNF